MISIRWKGLKEQQRLMKIAEKKIKAAIKKEAKSAGSIVVRKARRNLRAAYPNGTGLGAKSIISRVTFTDSFRGAKAVTEIKPRRDKRGNEQRRPGYWRIPSAYLPALEWGGTVRRRGNRRDSLVPRRAHVAHYRGRRWFRSAVDQTRQKVLDRFGKVFEVVR